MISKTYIYVFLFFIFLLQYVHSDYGNKVNNFSYLDSSYIQDFESIKKSNDSIFDSRLIRSENNDKRLMRYALYSVESDEMLNIRALSRIKPLELKFDPYFYSYGGGYLYPLGGWFYILSKFEVIQIGDLNWMMQNPDNVEKIYKFGRIFVLIAFLFSALFLYHLICTFKKPNVGLLATLVYLTSPALLMFSIIMKPHAYALFWCNLTLLLLFKSWKSSKLSSKDITLVGISLGFAVGSVTTYGIFALFVWFGLLYIVISNKIKVTSLFVIPLISIATFFILNPYIIFNFESYILEYQSQSTWFDFEVSFNSLINLLRNSVFLGLGLSYFILFFYVLIIYFQNFSSLWKRLNIIGIVLTIIFVAFYLASLGKWHVNSRYFFYLAPILIIVFLFYKDTYITTILAILLGFNIIQSFPLALAYHDEDNEKYSTRLNSAVWINNNIDKNKIICTSGNSISPYDSPPFDFMSYQIVNSINECDILISVERRSDHVDSELNSTLLARFKPRYNIKSLPFVFSHINPQISIYRLEHE
jgi:hypothetical protein